MRHLKRLLVFPLLCLTIVVCSCGTKLITEEDILNFLADSNYLGYGYDGEIAEDIIIDRRDTDAKEKTDLIYCTVNTSNDYRKLSRQYKIEGHLYSENGWLIDKVEQYQTAEWTDTPLRGVDSETVIYETMSLPIYYDGNYTVYLDDTSKIGIVDQVTDLENMTDEVKVDISVTQDSRKIDASYELVFEYING